MKMRKSMMLLLVVALFACKKEDDTPVVESVSIEATWQLDEIYQDDVLYSSGTDIKDRYTLAFADNKTYIHKLIDDEYAFEGTWVLSDDNKILTITTNKGYENSYDVVSLTNNELQLSILMKDLVVERSVFSKI